ncbi:hypothetical protein CJF42_10375 [Pseudoalteromonas sp. NBT06-2]|nr:hypothetical protein CJF42_10375 [Pseudoalteromonas sp. NBT06-2]
MYSFFIFFSNTSTANEIALVSLVEKKDNYIKYSAMHNKGYFMENIILKRRKALGTDWVLFFSAINGLKIRKQDKVKIKHHVNIPEKVFIDVLSVLLTDISFRSEINLGSITIAYRLLHHLWPNLVEKVKQLATKNKGVVRHKNKVITISLQSAIKNSKLMIDFCEIVKSYSYHCLKDDWYIDPIAFDHSYLNKDWNSLLNLPDAGIHINERFSISIQKDKN